MSEDLSSKTTLVYDLGGLFLPVAERLARDFGRVYYHTPWEIGFSKIHAACVGEGIEGIERCNDIWTVKNKVDCFVFPDVGTAGLQLELESQGKPVWGSRRGSRLELDREYFLERLSALGLDVPTYTVCEGMTELAKELKGRKNVYVKISMFRGMQETKHWRSWKEDNGLLDLWSLRWGPLKEHVPFLVFDAIETEMEIGGDTYCVDGRWPSLMIHGLEAKDEAYFGAVTPREDMPDELTSALDAFSEDFAKVRYRNKFSMEVRVTDTEAFFTDPTCRGGLPSTGTQLEIWSNFSEIVWGGAHGELVQPEPAAKFSMECAVKQKADRCQWSVVEVPEGLSPWLKLANCCQVDGITTFPPTDDDDHHIGWLVAQADTPRATLERMKELAAMLPEGTSASVESLAEVIKEIEVAETDDIPFTNLPLPEPEEVLE